MEKKPQPNQYSPPKFKCVITIGDETPKYMADFMDAKLKLARVQLEKLNVDELKQLSKMLELELNTAD